MKRRLASVLFCAAAGTFQVLAQQTSATAQQPPALALNPAQTEGRALFSKSCSICHLPPQFGAGTYGPRLNQASLGGNESVMREVISNGTPRMPAFKHNYNPVQIDAIIGYLKTVPAQANPASATLPAPMPMPAGSGVPAPTPIPMPMPMPMPTGSGTPMPMPVPMQGGGPILTPAAPGSQPPMPIPPRQN